MEVILRTTDKRVDKGAFISNRPSGSVITGKHQRQIRYKWVEILGDLFSLGMSVGTLAEISDPSFVFHPRHNLRVNPTLRLEITTDG